MYHMSIADPNFIPVPGNETEGWEEEFSNHSMFLNLFYLPFPYLSVTAPKDTFLAAILT